MKKEKLNVCKRCNGRGLVAVDWGNGVRGLQTCPKCYGEGKVKNENIKNKK